MGFDYLDEGSLLYEPDAYSNAPAYVERLNIDLDEQQFALNTQKTFVCLMPQVATTRDTPIVVQLGAGLFPNGRVYEDPVLFDPNTHYKVDSRASGRYLNARFARGEALAGFRISGFDIKALLKARR